MTADDKAPVCIVMDGKYLVHAGDANAIGKKKLGQYAQAGHKIKTITIKKYRETHFTWIYDKPKPKNEKRAKHSGI